MPTDYSLEATDAGLVAHRPDCPVVRAAADRGEPVATLLGCTGELPADIGRHRCLEQDDKNPPYGGGGRSAFGTY